MDPGTEERVSLMQFVTGAVLAGIVIAILNNVYHLIYTSVSGVKSSVINVGSVTAFSLIPVFAGAFIYYALSRFTRYSTFLFITGALLFTFISLAEPLSPTLPDGSPKPEGFVALTVPMHLIAGILTVIIIPRFVRK